MGALLITPLIITHEPASSVMLLNHLKKYLSSSSLSQQEG